METRVTIVTPMTTEWMVDLDARYRVLSGLNDRRFYSIFYSRVQPADVLVLGLNPGGDPATWTPSDIADTDWYEQGQHEYVDMDYPIAVAMRRYLVEVLQLASPEEIRAIPKSNLAFRRSSSSDTLGMSMRDAVREAAPFVREIIGASDPSIVVLEGSQTARLFAVVHARGWERDTKYPKVTTPNGSHDATIFEVAHAELTDGRRVLAVAIGHPSRYSRRREWADVVESSRRVVESIETA